MSFFKCPSPKREAALAHRDRATNGRKSRTLTDPNRKGTVEPGGIAGTPQATPWFLGEARHLWLHNSASQVPAWEQDASPGLRAPQHSRPQQVLFVWFSAPDNPRCEQLLLSSQGVLAVA